MTNGQRHHAALPPGYKLHWYEIESILGQGGFGITYLAQDTTLDTKVAIKEFLPTDLAVRTHDSSVQPMSGQHRDTFTWGLSRFLAEAKTLAKFQHPNIVRVNSGFEANNTAYMVMEYVEGQTLEEALKFRRVHTEQQLLDVLFPLLDGLEKVHATGFIHRDIKPENIYLREDGTPLLIDFGSARQAIGTKTRTLTALVTPGYAPYEQYSGADGADKQGPWTDIYALGATLYRAVSGKPPINAMQRVEGVLAGSDSLVPAMAMGEGLHSTPFLEAIDCAIQFLPENRPKTIADWRSMFPEVAGKPEHPQSAVETVAAVAPPRVEALPARGKSAAVRWATAAVVTAVLAGGGYVLWPLLGPLLHPIAAPPAVSEEGQTEITRDSARLIKLRKEMEGDKARLAELQGALESARASQASEAAKLAETKRKAEAEAARVVALEDRSKAQKAREAAAAREAEAQKAADAKRRAEERARLVAIQRQMEEEKAREAAAAREAEEAAAREAELVRQEQAAAAARLAEDKRQREAEQAREAAAAEAARQAAAEETAAQEAAARAAKHEEKVAALLAAGAEDLAALRLTSPGGNNAFESFSAVLDIAPDNVQAKQGLLDIADQYIGLAGKAAASGGYARAERYLAKAESVAPGAETITFARESIAEQRAEAERAAAEQEKQRLEQERLAAAEKRRLKEKLLAAEAERKVEEETQQLALARQPQADIEQAVKVQPRKGTPSPPYKIAIFPMGNAQDYAAADKSVVKSLARYIRRNNLLTLTYAYFSDPSESIERDEVWNNPKAPRVDAVIARATKLGVHGVAMGSLFVKTRSTSPRFKLKFYLIDIGRGKVFESEGDSDRTTSIAKKAFSEFLPGMRAASQAQ